MMSSGNHAEAEGMQRMRRSDRARWGLYVFLLFAFALRVWRLDVQNIWWDEARNIDVALRPLAAIPLAPELDIHPPGYFILLHFWTKWAGHTAFATRFFSVWFGVLLIPLVVALARRMRMTTASIFAALYVTLAPFLIGEAQETRMYTLAFVLLTLTAIAMWDLLRGHRRAWIGLGVLTAASVLVHYSTVFVLIALYLYAFAYATYRVFRPGPHAQHPAPHPTPTPLSQRQPTTPYSLLITRYSPLLFAGLLSVILFLPQAPRAYQQIAPYGNPNLIVPTFGEYVRQLWHAYTVGIPAEGAWVPYALTGLALILGVGLVYEMWARRGRTLWMPLAFLLTATILPVLLYYAILVRRATFAPRYISFVLPFLALLIGMALRGWWRVHRGVGGGITVALLAMLVLGIHADQFNPRYFREDTAGLARWLVAHTGPDDIVLIDVPYPLGFYYPRFSKNPDVPPDGPEDIAPAYYLFVDIHHVDERLNQLAAGKTRVFWVQWYKSDTDPRGAVDFLLRKYGVHAGKTAFRGYTVDWYHMPEDVHYRLAEGLRSVRVTFDGRVQTVNVAAYQAPPVPADVLRASDEGWTPRPVWAVVDWQRVGDATSPYKVSARLHDPLGQVVAQDDRRLISDRHLAFPYWQEGEIARNVYLLRLPLGTPPGTYALTLRVYNPQDLSPLPAKDDAGQPQGPDAVVATVRVGKATLFPPVTPVALKDAAISLVKYEVGRQEAAPGTVVPISLLWVKEEATEGEPLRVQLLLLDEAGRAHSFDEMPPVSWYPTNRWEVGEVVRGTLPWRLAPDTPNGTYRVHLRLVDRFGQILDETDLGSLQVKGRPHRFQVPTVEHPLAPPPHFDDVAALLGYDMAGEMKEGGHITVTLVWQALNPSHRNYKVSVQLLDASNRVLAQEDHIPLRGEAPTTSWLPGEILQDRFEVTLPKGTSVRVTRVVVVMYDEATLQRVPVMWQGQEKDHVVIWEAQQ